MTSQNGKTGKTLTNQHHGDAAANSCTDKESSLILCLPKNLSWDKKTFVRPHVYSYWIVSSCLCIEDAHSFIFSPQMAECLRSEKVFSPQWQRLWEPDQRPNAKIAKIHDPQIWKRNIAKLAIRESLTPQKFKHIRQSPRKCAVLFKAICSFQ